MWQLTLCSNGEFATLSAVLNFVLTVLYQCCMDDIFLAQNRCQGGIYTLKFICDAAERHPLILLTSHKVREQKGSSYLFADNYIAA